MKRREYGGYNTYSSDRPKQLLPFKKTGVYLTNLARSSLNLLLQMRSPKEVFAPYYTCHSVHQVLNRTVNKITYYHINDNFEPILDNWEYDEDKLLLVNNYFGVYECSANKALSKFDSAIVIDNSQGFYSTFPSRVDQILSPRKFFGLTDGGVLLTNLNISHLYESLERDKSADRIKHLFACEESSKNDTYNSYLEYRENIQNLPVNKMSVSTRHLMETIDYEFCKYRRNTNFNLMHNTFKNINLLEIPNNKDLAPMCYPLLVDTKHLKNRLINSSVYVGTYWPISPLAKEETYFESLLRSNLCCLPIDQSMSEENVRYVIKQVEKHLSY